MCIGQSFVRGLPSELTPARSSGNDRWSPPWEKCISNAGYPGGTFPVDLPVGFPDSKSPRAKRQPVLTQYFAILNLTSKGVRG